MTRSYDIEKIESISEVIQSANLAKEPLFLKQNGKEQAVIYDITSYKNLQNSITLLKLITQSEKEIKNSEMTDQDKLFEELEKELF